jgi:spore germination protein GerM
MEKKKFVIYSIVIILVLASIFVMTRIYRNENKIKEKGVRQVELYFSTHNAMYLASETREVNNDDLFFNTLQELIKGPETSSLNKTIPEGVKVLGININEVTARINFNSALTENHWGGSTGERMTVYSIVNTMTQFDAIEKVQILIAGEEIKTLAGHLGLTEPLSENDNLYK